MKIQVSKQDIIWSYLAKAFNLGIGLFTLPAILKLLNSDEVGVNYILVSINSMIVLFDMGFSSQFSRYLTYIFSGAQIIQKEGVASDYGDNINTHLLATTITTAKTIYRMLSALALLILLSFGTIYLYHVTNGFSTTSNLLLVWIIFCISAFFNLYYLYLNSFLTSRGLVKESNQASVLSRIVQLAILAPMLFMGYGLLSVVISNLVAPFAFRFYAHKHFYSEDLRQMIKAETVNREEIKQTLRILFYNAKKIGVIAIFAALIGYASPLIIALYLPLSVVGSYGVLTQLVGIIGTMSCVVYTAKMPQFSNLILVQDSEGLKREFGLSMFFFYFIYVLGLCVLLFMPYVFKLFNFSVTLPSVTLVFFYGVTRFIEQNQSAYCQLLVAQNKLLYYKSSIITCIAMLVLLFVFLKLGWGLWGVVLSQALPLFAYCAWKWPAYVCMEFEINIYKNILSDPLKLFRIKLLKWKRD